ncbi:hypothetical protein VCHE48_0362 [Vibrio cholerae HE48]|nr:hypothetical protein VCHE48_0362 [Vibrio cholerae HE48]
MLAPKFSHQARVHCRTGSLESNFGAIIVGDVVHCRTGSLESLAPSF